MTVSTSKSAKDGVRQKSRANTRPAPGSTALRSIGQGKSSRSKPIVKGGSANPACRTTSARPKIGLGTANVLAQSEMVAKAFGPKLGFALMMMAMLAGTHERPGHDVP